MVRGPPRFRALAEPAFGERRLPRGSALEDMGNGIGGKRGSVTLQLGVQQ